MKYDPSMKFIEDYELFWRISEEYMVGNLSQRLYMYRVSPDSVSSRNIAEQVTNKYLLIEKKVYHRNYEGSHLPINRKAMLTIKIEKNVVGRAVKHGHGDITYVIGVIKSKHCPLSIKCLDYILAAFEYLKFIINDALTRIASQLHRR